MPPGKRRQSNAMLYTLITFVGLFIAGTTVAVIYYVKAEDLRTQRNDLQQEMDRLATREEVRNLGNIVGAKGPGSYFGTMVTHFDQMARLVGGGPAAPTSAEVKVANAMKAVSPLLDGARTYIDLPAPAPADANAADSNAEAPIAGEPNAVAPVQVALTRVVSELLIELEQTTEGRRVAEQEVSKVRQERDAALEVWEQTRQELTARVDQYRQEVEATKADYNDLRALVNKNSDDRAQILLDQLEQAKANAKQLTQDLLRTQAELNVARVRLQNALAAVKEIKPAPDRESVACQPDGEVILVDEAAGVVRVNLGSEDRVYRGLTFAVYDRSAGVTPNEEPKAQVEVFAVDRRTSAARILSSERRNPIITGDIVANLIWDCDARNQFVIAGHFDLDGDGKLDYDAIRKIESLIQKWGGTVSNEVSAETDYVILGKEPQVPPEPTLEILAVDPTATEKYNAIRQDNERYNQVRQRAEALWIPIFSYDRFLHFTGYASQVGKPGAF